MKRGKKTMFNRCSIFTTKYFFTFEDVIRITGQASVDKLPYQITWGAGLNEPLVVCGFTTIIPAVIYKNWPSALIYDVKPHLSELFQKLYARYWKEYVFSLYTEDKTSNEYTEAKNELYTKIGTIIMSTYDRYNKLLDTYTSELSKLLDGVKTTTQGIGSFNDTPQNIQTSQDDYSGDSHISNISKSSAVATSDLDTKMGRIDEIQRKLRNIWKDWLEEFESLFLERGNVE